MSPLICYNFNCEKHLVIPLPVYNNSEVSTVTMFSGLFTKKPTRMSALELDHMIFDIVKALEKFQSFSIPRRGILLNIASIDKMSHSIIASTTTTCLAKERLASTSQATSASLIHMLFNTVKNLNLKGFCNVICPYYLVEQINYLPGFFQHIVILDASFLDGELIRVRLHDPSGFNASFITGAVETTLRKSLKTGNVHALRNFTFHYKAHLRQIEKDTCGYNVALIMAILIQTLHERLCLLDENQELSMKAHCLSHYLHDISSKIKINVTFDAAALKKILMSLIAAKKPIPFQCSAETTVTNQNINRLTLNKHQ